MITRVKDPVFGMAIDPKNAFLTREHDGKTFCFCSQDCIDQFDADLHKYGHTEEHKIHEQNHSVLTYTAFHLPYHKMAYPNNIGHFAYIESGRNPLVYHLKQVYTNSIS